MDLIVQVNSREALEAALEAGVAGVTVNLPRDPESAWWTEAAAWLAAAWGRGVGFLLQWDRLVREEELPGALEILAAVAALNPDALILRDLGLCWEARRRHPDLVLHAAGGLGLHNSPGLALAERLGFRRVLPAGPMQLTDLALLGRQSALPLEMELPLPCPTYGHLCLLDEYPGAGRSSCCQPTRPAAESLLAALELLPGPSQLGVAAVRLGGVFSQAEPLCRLIELFRLMEETTPAGRPRVLAAARQVLEAFGDDFRLESAARETAPGEKPLAAAPAGRLPAASPEARRSTPSPGPVWLEVRGYAEAAALDRNWRDPLILELTRENYAAFLSQYRHWQPRRLIWRLPAVIRESALPFIQQAIATLMQGGFSRFVAGDWGAVALARKAGGAVYGEPTLGVRNSSALLAARELGVSKVCLPPGRGPQAWQALVQAAPAGSFWGHLYQVPVLAAGPGAEGSDSRESRPAGEKLRWLAEGDLALLCPEAPEDFGPWRAWFTQHRIAPLVVSLPHSGLPWGQVPDLARPPRPEPQHRPGPRSPRRSGKR
jgi:collagenase-like PrtC family protease